MHLCKSCNFEFETEITPYNGTSCPICRSAVLEDEPSGKFEVLVDDILFLRSAREDHARSVFERRCLNAQDEEMVYLTLNGSVIEEYDSLYDAA